MEDEESILEYIDEKSYTVGIDDVKGRTKPTLSEINVYTDGSKTKQRSGAGYVIMAGKAQVKFTHSLVSATKLHKATYGHNIPS